MRAVQRVQAFFLISLLLLKVGGLSLAQTRDFANSRQADAWLRHPVYGDPSFDSFEHAAGNPIHRGTQPFEWPVNGFLFHDPVSRNWFVYVGDYGKGYVQPPSRCLLYRSADGGTTWTNLGVVLQGDKAMFDRGGHTPDVSVVYAEQRYHMVYDWGETNFNAEGGLAYAWADKPEGPWHRAAEPITRNSKLTKLLGRYQRTYAATLLRRKHDWLILAMMDFAPTGWALFAMTAPQPEGPWSERQLLRHVEADYYHPPLMEFFPAFAHGGFAYAPSTSVALNRNFNVLFRAPLEHAHEPAAWSLFQHGSVWHAEDVEHEFHGIWGQTFSGVVDQKGMLHAMFPSRDAQGRGTINLAQRRWHNPLRTRGFVLTGHAGPSLTLLRATYDDFQLDTQFQLRGRAELLLDYAAPLSPNVPSSDATLHSLMSSRQTVLQFVADAWKLIQRDTLGREAVLASARLPASQRFQVTLKRSDGRLTLNVNHQTVWAGELPVQSPSEPSGVLGWRVAANSHLEVGEFKLRGRSQPAHFFYGANEALLGAAEPAANWEARTNSIFRFGIGSVARETSGRAKWNVIGRELKLWSPRGPEFGRIVLRLDGRDIAELDLHAEQPEPSRVVWQSVKLKEDFHALIVTSKNGRLPLDSLEVVTREP